jgi:hypothetical protein
MKKKILYVLIAAFFVLLLSGCDDILEEFFPEFADKNAIDVHVIIDQAYDVGSFAVVVALIPLDAGAPQKDLIWKEWRHEHDFFVSYEGLPHGAYRIYVWLDSGGAAGGFDNDRFIDRELGNGGIPKGAAEHSGGPVFEFIEGGPNMYYNALADLAIGPFPDPGGEIQTALSP